MENSNVLIVFDIIFYFLLDASEIFDAIPPLPEKDLEQERLDKALGCVIGAFIGDTLGSAIEFKSVITQNMLRQALEMNGGVFGNGPGQVTDDSELAMCLLHGLADTAPLFSLESIASYYKR